MSDFRIWWEEYGRDTPQFNGENNEEYSRRVAETAWLNGAYKELERYHEESK